VILSAGCKKSEIGSEGISATGGRWSATYSGIAHHEQGALNQNNQYKTTEFDEAVIIDAENGSTPNRFSVFIQFQNSPEIIHKDFEFTGKNTYSQTWGSGSSAGSLNIRFTDDSIYYRSTQHCGVVCYHEVEMALKKSE
jgi:hypothetical protein